MSAGTQRAREGWLAVLLFALALVPRYVGLEHLLPHSPEPDAVYALQPEFLRGPTTNPEYASYPYLVGWLVAHAPESEELAPDATLDARLERAAEPLARVRWVVATCAALIAPATFWIARAFFGVGWACLAGLFAATSLMHQNLSQQGRPHAALAAALALAVALAIRARQSGTSRDWLGASAAAAFALALLQSGVFALASLVAAFALRERARRSDWTRWLATLAIVGATVWCAYPFLRPDELARWSRVAEGKLQFGGHNLVYAKFDGLGLVVMLEGLWSCDPVLLGAAALGVLAGWRALRRTRGAPAWRGAQRDAVVLAAASVAYALVFGLYHGSLDRFALPLVAALAVLATAGVRALALRLSTRTAVHVALALGVLALPAFAVGKLAWLRARPDTLEVAAQRIDRELPPHAQLAVQPWFELPLATSRDARLRDEDRARVALRYFWARFELAHPAPGGRTAALLPDGRARFWRDLANELEPELDRLGATHVVCFGAYEDPLHARSAVLFDLAHERLTSVVSARALPRSAPGLAALQYESPRLLADVLAARAVGPEVEIFSRAKSGQSR